MSLPPYTGSVELESFRQHVIELLSGKRQRPDGRAANEPRVPDVTRDVVSCAAAKDGPTGAVGGSAKFLSSILYTDASGTQVMCSVKGVFGLPAVERPHDGRISVSLSFPFSSAYGANAQHVAVQLAGFVSQILCQQIDLQVLCVYPGEACWILLVELAVLNAEGGLRAACLHSAVAALHGLVLPRSRLPNGDIVEPRPVSFSPAGVPVAVTVGIIRAAEAVDGQGSPTKVESTPSHGSPGASAMLLLLDTTAAEESVADVMLTLVVPSNAPGEQLLHVSHQGRYPVVTSRLLPIIQQSFAPHVQKIASAISTR